MAYTFGAATGDDATWTDSSSPWGATARSGIIAGWFYPTTLTPGRALWSVGADNRCLISPSGTEIDIFVRRSTANSQDRTLGLNLVTQQWTFIAILASHQNTGAVDNFRIWRGFGTDIPTLVPLDTPPVAGTGTGLTTATTITVGNVQATGALAFQGDIGRFDYIVATVANALCQNTSGLISADDEFAIYTNIVFPIWQGGFPTFYGSGQNSNNGITHSVLDLDNRGGYVRSIRNGGSIITMDRSVAISGATISQNRAPIGQMRPVAWPDRLRR